jgi:hypothetical protein
VAEIRSWLTDLGGDADARTAMVQQTLEGAVRSLTRRAHGVADACVEQTEAAERLREGADAAYDHEVDRLLGATADGSLLRGEVLVRWQEFVGTGELLRTLEAQVGRLRDRMVNVLKGKPQQAERVSVAVEFSLETLILEHAEAAAERAEASWRSLAPGQALLSDVGEDLGRASHGMRRQAERAVRDWQQDVLEMVRTEGADKRTTARFLAYGVNGLSVSLMVVVFASTAGLTGAELGIAGGSAILGQKVLEAVFGDQALRTLAERARRKLETRVRGLLDEDRNRYLDLLASLGLEPGAADRLRDAARAVDDLRYASVERTSTHSY